MIEEKLLCEIKKVASEFLNVDKIIEIQEIKSGHINSTFLIIMPEAQYILQQINTNVFPSPFGMMHNIKEVTEHIRKKVIYEGKDPNRSVLNIIKTVYDQVLCIRNDKYWRCMQFIDNSTAYEHFESPQMFFEMGKAVGGFQNLLEGFHTRVLDETIKHFHDTPYRYHTFLDVIKIDRCERASSVKKEITFFRKHLPIYALIVDKLASKEIPRRVTHNDTKPSNVLIDNETGEALCLIDLDTVMRGSLLYDYGDALRIGASTAKEDEKDLNLVNIDLKLFKAFTKGFLLSVKPIITQKEVQMLYEGFLIITCEIAMRFLTDYIDGDNYFRVSYPEHNLVRARNQIKMVEEIEDNHNEIIRIINEILEELGYDDSYLISSLQN